MTSVEQILSQIPALAKPQRSFIASLITALSLFVGRATMTNLHRYGAASPRTQRRWHTDRRSFDFAGFDRRLLEANALLDGPLAVAIDATFIPKSGKHTFGLANFCDSSQDRAHKGLELSLLALVGLGEQPRAWPLHASQTPAEMALPDKRTTHHINHLESERHLLPEGVNHVLADNRTKILAELAASYGAQMADELRPALWRRFEGVTRVSLRICNRYGFPRGVARRRAGCGRGGGDGRAGGWDACSISMTRGSMMDLDGQAQLGQNRLRLVFIGIDQDHCFRRAWMSMTSRPTTTRSKGGNGYVSAIASCC